LHAGLPTLVMLAKSSDLRPGPRCARQRLVTLFFRVLRSPATCRSCQVWRHAYQAPPARHLSRSV